MAIYHELPGKTVPKLKKILFIHLVLLTIIYASIAFFGYMLFYDSPNIGHKTILEHFKEQNNLFLLLANALVVCTALNFFVCNFKPVKDAIYHLFKHKIWGRTTAQEALSESDYELSNIILTLFLLGAVMLVSSILIKNEIGFLDIIGILCDVVYPILYVFIPLLAFSVKQRRAFTIFILVIVGLLYLWRLSEYISLVI